MDAPSSLKASSHTSLQFSGAEADQAPDETKGIELYGVSTAQDSVWGAEEVIEAYAKATKPTPTSAEDWPMALNGFSTVSSEHPSTIEQSIVFDPRDTALH
ncbi:hypothetical protein ONZ51_g12599 [Trametes cubensis]|uniref:Uncharacterized protein n=1 Tax=Trametes cubensis TaxID=1111947 RepID=A0AAD7X4S0_9APHY|nr:hypothetical protein ONZ51_g12599 [Trametes cubensis]